MDTGAGNPIAQQEKQIEQVIVEVQRLRNRNEELSGLVSRLKEIIGKANIACEESFKPDSGVRG